ncbi:MAG: GTP cyclohydrolase FolE2 [Gammaproteobacteria bacterium]|nr:GTP cyclohydrolase FolE2 [Gammaproteobacteria bacterium]
MPISKVGLNKSTVDAIADVQGSPDNRRISIDKVGIKDIRHPVRVSERSGGEQHTVATFSMYVELPHNFKGTHMSRFVRILNQHESEISIRSFRHMIGEMTELLEAENGQIEMRFPYFINKKAPVSGVESVIDYDVTLVGEIKQGRSTMHLKVQVPVTSLCPCSKEISAYGAHNQRSHIAVSVESSAFIWIEEIVDMVEKEASSELYGLLKRMDEKHVTERAYDNPKFVEDMVRDVAVRLDDEERVIAYTVEAENFESIHNHSAYAQIARNKSRDRDGGNKPG